MSAYCRTAQWWQLTIPSARKPASLLAQGQRTVLFNRPCVTTARLNGNLSECVAEVSIFHFFNLCFHWALRRVQWVIRREGCYELRRAEGAGCADSQRVVRCQCGQFDLWQLEWPAVK
jgi:hypothetical protein